MSGSNEIIWTASRKAGASPGENQESEEEIETSICRTHSTIEPPERKTEVEKSMIDEEIARIFETELAARRYPLDGVAKRSEGSETIDRRPRINEKEEGVHGRG